MGQQEPSWYTDKHRRLAEAEEARRRWMMDTAQWHYPRPSGWFGSMNGAGWGKLIIGTLIIVFLMELMIQRSISASPVTDELIGMPASSSE